MHLYVTVHNPLARLTRLLATIEEARGGQVRAVDAHCAALHTPDTHVADRGALERMSLTERDHWLEGDRDPLGFVSLTHTERASGDSHRLDL